jgi:hypothetical protein
MSPGNARQVAFWHELDYQQMADGLAQTIDRFGWELLGFVLMSTYFHLVALVAMYDGMCLPRIVSGSMSS